MTMTTARATAKAPPTAMALATPKAIRTAKALAKPKAIPTAMATATPKVTRIPKAIPMPGPAAMRMTTATLSIRMPITRTGRCPRCCRPRKSRAEPLSFLFKYPRWRPLPPPAILKARLAPL